MLDPKAMQITVLFIVAVAVTFGATYYFCWGQFMDDNLVYMATYNEHMALNVGRFTDIGSVYWGMAYRYCALYWAERRALPNAAYNKTCAEILNGDFHDRGIDFENSTVYFSAVFNTAPRMCRLGREVVPCPTYPYPE